MDVVVLGRVGLLVDGVHRDVGRAQARAVLALLAIHVGEPVGVDGIIRALWGGTEPATARTQVQNAVSGLRRAFADAGLAEAVQSGRYGYRLTIPASHVDIARFDALVRAAGALAAQDADGAVAALREALGLWRGTPLADAAGAFVDAMRATLEERRLVALERLADIELARQRASTVITDLMPIVAEYPFRESLRLRLMLALQQHGRHSEALQSFRGYRKMLAEHEGLDPGADLSRVALEILRQNSDPDFVEPVPSDATPTEQVTRVNAPAQLPAAVAGFVGRRGHLEELNIIASDSARVNRVVALCGMAGVGKTALVTEWAHRAIAEFPDGQLFADLRGFTPGAPLAPAVVLARFLRALGEPPDAIPNELDEAAALYRTRLSGRRVLVVLDNAGGGEQIRPLLPGSPTCLTIVTSRDSLTGLVARDGAHRITLEPLTRTESERLVRGLLRGYGASAEAEVVAALATACGHLPLALRLAVANLAETGQDVGASAGDLNAAARLALMEADGDRDASVRGAFDQSYASLPSDTRRLFLAFGLVPGGDLTVGLASAMTDSDAGPGLRQLTRLSLAHAAGPERYAIHDLVRAYASAMSEEGGSEHRAEAMRRMHRWYLDGIGSAAALLYPQMMRLPDDTPAGAWAPSFAAEPAALAWLDAELPNLVALVTHAADHGPPGAAARLSDALRGYFWIRRYTAEWLTVAQAAVAAAEREDDQAGLAANRIGLGSVYRCLSRYAESAAEFEQSLATSRAIQWPEAEATALAQLAVVHADVGRSEMARERLIEALAVNRALGRTGSEAVVLGNLGALRIRMGELAQAVLDFTEALALYRKVGAPGGEAISLTNLGLTYFYLGRFRESGQSLDEALTLQRKIGDRYGMAVSLSTLAYLRSEEGEAAEAIELATNALEVTREAGDGQGEAFALITLGHIRRRLGAATEALAAFRQGRDLAAAADEWLPLVESMIGEAQALLGLGDTDTSLEVAERALRHARQRSFHLLSAQALTVASAVHLAAGRPVDAWDCAMHALKRHQEIGHLPGAARTHRILGEICRATGDEGSSASWLDLAAAQYAEIGLADRLD